MAPPPGDPRFSMLVKARKVCNGDEKTSDSPPILDPDICLCLLFLADPESEDRDRRRSSPLDRVGVLGIGLPDIATGGDPLGTASSTRGEDMLLLEIEWPDVTRGGCGSLLGALLLSQADS